ncbi:MAG TPA: hypothetical protein PKD12_18090 [Nitrospira sp.]|nr:hypothetical protein [Nitrospira sp.]
MRESTRIPIDGGSIKLTGPFATLQNARFPTGSLGLVSREQSVPVSKNNRGCVDIVRQTAHRGRTTLTLPTVSIGIDQREKEVPAK